MAGCTGGVDAESSRRGAIVVPLHQTSLAMPGSGPHRFGVDNARQLAFFPNDAEGWNRRVIWTMDVRDPLSERVHLSPLELLGQSFAGMAGEVARRAIGRRPVSNPAAGA